MSKELYELMHDFSEAEVLEQIQSQGTHQAEVDMQNLLLVSLVMSLMVLLGSVL